MPRPGVEVAILAVPVSQLLPALEQCAAAGVGCCVIITTGFAEADEAGAELQQRVLDIAQPAGMRIVGPNCMGLINPGAQLALCSSIVLDTERLMTGRIGLVSQSGALMVSMFDRAAGEGIGFSAAISLGNQSDLEICDFLEYFVDDPATDALCVYIEGLRDPARFVRAAAACKRAGKPMIVVKTGKTDDGVRAARSHTASLAGSYDAFAAVCRANGVVLVDDPVTMIRVADLLLRYPHLTSDGIGIVSGSGGGNGIMVDRLAGAGLRLARTSPATRAALGEMLLPPQADNPVDLGGRLPSQSDDVAGPALRALAADADVGMTLLYVATMPGFEARIRALTQAALDSGKPVVAVGAAGTRGRKASRGPARNELPVFRLRRGPACRFARHVRPLPHRGDLRCTATPRGSARDVAADWRSVEARGCVRHCRTAGHSMRNTRSGCCDRVDYRVSRRA